MPQEIFMDIDEITIEKEFQTWWDNVKTDKTTEIQRIEMMKSFYAGAGSLGFVISVLTDHEDKQKAGETMDRLMEEIKNFFEHRIAEMVEGIKSES